MDHLRHIGNNIQTARKHRGMTQKELAEKVGLHQPDIAEIEAGERNISINTLVKIASALRFYIDINLTPQK